MFEWAVGLNTDLTTLGFSPEKMSFEEAVCTLARMIKKQNQKNDGGYVEL